MSYADGNGNYYEIHEKLQKVLEYHLITPENSSSESYCGGAHKKRKLKNILT